jgi:hypothetical protein
MEGALCRGGVVFATRPTGRRCRVVATSYVVAPAVAPPAPVAAPARSPVLVAFAPPARQRRLTVAGRLFLVLPHLILLAYLGVAAVAVTVIGWFAALFLGRLPRLTADFLPGYLRWQTRVSAYLFLLTDVYPPFSVRDSAYPVRVTTETGRLGRWSVAGRLLLALPALVVAAAVTYGIATVLLVVAWLIVLVTGRLPSSLHQTFAAFIRYQVRVAAYLGLVTSAYPWGLLGDPETTAVAGVSDWQPHPPSPVHDPYWRVVLTARAKNLVVFLLLFAVASAAVVNITVTLSRYDQLHRDEAAGTRIQNAYQTLGGDVIGYETQTRVCDGTTEPLPCLTTAALTVARAFTVFDRHLTATSVPAAALAARVRVMDDSAEAARAFRQLSASNSPGYYQLTIESTDLPRLLSRFDQDYERLGAQLDDLG